MSPVWGGNEKKKKAEEESLASKSGNAKKKILGPGGIRTHAPCEIGALIQRLRPTRPPDQGDCQGSEAVQVLTCVKPAD